MVLCGDIIDYPLAELLFFLSSKQRSGWLDLVHPSMSIRLTLRHGRLIAARSDQSGQRLGQRLIEDGHLSSSQLESALSMQTRTDEAKPLGAILVEMGFVEEGPIQQVLRDQVADCLFQVLVSTEGTFRFERKQTDVFGIDLDVAIEREVLDAIRRADEWLSNQMEWASFRLNPEVTDDMLEPLVSDYWDVIDVMMDDVLTVAEIAARTGQLRSSVSETLLRLQAQGVVSVASVPVGFTCPYPTFSDSVMT